MFLFSVGMGIPLIVGAGLMAQVLPLLNRFDRAARYLSLAGAAMMLAMAVLLLSDNFMRVWSASSRAVGRQHLPSPPMTEPLGEPWSPSERHFCSLRDEIGHTQLTCGHWEYVGMGSLAPQPTAPEIKTVGVVQEILGHATISITANVYGHLVPELQQDAPSRTDDARGWAL